ncbi:NfeD family protein [bacterium]|nr:NfeD family protein [bacterium]
MYYWEIFVVVAIVAIILEMFTPTLFFLSIALAALVTAIVSLFGLNMTWLIIICSALSLVSLLFVRPWLKALMHHEPNGVEFKSEYIGKIVKATEDITTSSGAIAIYGERWDARLSDEKAEKIPAGEEVKIVKNDSIVLYVEKI